MSGASWSHNSSTCLTTEPGGEVTNFRHQVRATASFVSIETVGICWILNEGSARFATSRSVIFVIAVSRFNVGTFVCDVLTIC